MLSFSHFIHYVLKENLDEKPFIIFISFIRPSGVACIRGGGTNETHFIHPLLQVKSGLTTVSHPCFIHLTERSSIPGEGREVTSEGRSSSSSALSLSLFSLADDFCPRGTAFLVNFKLCKSLYLQMSSQWSLGRKKKKELRCPMPKSFHQTLN
jgi:hypothetical protein